ncbi:hypothetical protein Dimus_016330, partial [Dionaea muscipula]
TVLTVNQELWRWVSTADSGRLSVVVVSGRQRQGRQVVVSCGRRGCPGGGVKTAAVSDEDGGSFSWLGKQEKNKRK